MRADLRRAFLQQAEACRQLGSAFNGLVCELLSAHLDASTGFGRRIDDWQGSPVSDALALRAAGALHGLARSGRAPGLTAQYPPQGAGDPAALWEEIAAALRVQDEFLCAYLDSAPQTNEVARSSVLLGGALIIAHRTQLGLSWHEIGASAGLNLAFDRYRYELEAASHGDPHSPVKIRSRWEGKLPSLEAPLRLVERAGADRNPLYAKSAADRERLISYVWPDQTERIERTLAALDLAAASPWSVERAGAAEWVTARFSSAQPDGCVRVLAHTIVWQYLSQADRDVISSVMDSAGQRATERRPVAWFSMEADEVHDGAGLYLTLWPGGGRTLVGRADFHGRWVRWL